MKFVNVHIIIGQIIGPAAAGSAGPDPAPMLILTESGLKTNKNDRTIVKKVNNNNNNAIYVAQIRAQQQMGCRVTSVQTERLSA